MILLVIDQITYGTEGIYGIPIYVSATYIFLFILFGAFLEKAGMIKLFTDVSLGWSGPDRRRRQGGGAVLGADGDDLGLGRGQCGDDRTVYDPVDETLWLSSAFAGASRPPPSIWAADHAPVMGAVAFIMAETLGVEYAEVVRRRSSCDPVFPWRLLDGAS